MDMVTPFTIFAAAVFLFVVLLVAKQFVNKQVCVLCASIGITWVTLLVLYWSGVTIDPVLIALMMGQSIVGLFYLIEKNVSEKWHVFRLPFLLTLTFSGYVLMRGDKRVDGNIIVLLVSLWVVAGTVLAFRQNTSINQIMKKVIECCKNW